MWHSQDLTPLPIPEIYKIVVMAINITQVKTIPFINTISGIIQFGSAQTLPDETFKSIYVSLQKIIEIYTKYGFNITMDESAGEDDEVHNGYG